MLLLVKVFYSIRIKHSFSDELFYFPCIYMFYLFIYKLKTIALQRKNNLWIGPPNLEYYTEYSRKTGIFKSIFDSFLEQETK